MVERHDRLLHAVLTHISSTQWRAACNNQSETSVADACAAVCKLSSLTLYQPVAKVISALARAIFLGLIQVDRIINRRTLSHYIGDTNINARFRVQQLRICCSCFE